MYGDFVYYIDDLLAGKEDRIDYTIMVFYTTILTFLSEYGVRKASGGQSGGDGECEASSDR